MPRRAPLVDGCYDIAYKEKTMRQRRRPRHICYHRMAMIIRQRHANPHVLILLIGGVFTQGGKIAVCLQC